MFSTYIETFLPSSLNPKNGTKLTKFAFGREREENNVGGANAGYQHIFFSQKVFKIHVSHGPSKSWLCGTDASKLKEFANDNFKFDGNGTEF